MARQKSLKSILQEVVSQNKEDDAKLERHVVEKLLQDARAYAANRAQSSRREPSERIDHRFLTNVVKNVDSHNKGMLKMREKFAGDRTSRCPESRHDTPASTRSVDLESPRSSQDILSKTRRHASFESYHHSSSDSRTQHRLSHAARPEEEHTHRHRTGRSKPDGDKRSSGSKESSHKTSDKKSPDGQSERRRSEKRHRTHSHDKRDSHEKSHDREHRHRRESHSSENKHHRDTKRGYDEDRDRDRSHRKRHKKEEHLSRSHTQPEETTSRSAADDERYSRSKKVSQVSKMDKYFDEHYDPRIDLDLESIVDPKTGLLSASPLDDWDVQRGELNSNSSIGNPAILMNYSSRGQTREWDKGKGSQA